MKKLLSISIILLCSTSVFAKKVKFAVDMQNQTVNATGVHIVGDFQEVAGLGTNFGVMTPMTQEASSSVYSIVVDIPAFQKYEYKFANGDLFYEVEFVPVKSRVGYDFVDNRWIYVDSIANDTTFVGAILYAENAPYGYTMGRLLVDLTDEASVSADGVYIGGDFNAWTQNKTQIISLQGNTIYEGIVFLSAGTHDYKFYNGSGASDAETVPGSCAVSGNRQFDLSTDSVFAQVCFSSCTTCLGSASLADNTAEEALVFPQPFNEFTTIQFNGNITDNAVLVDPTGKVIETYSIQNEKQFVVYRNQLNPGIYYLQFGNSAEHSSIKLILQ